MLKAVIVDGNAVSRSMLASVLTEGSYNVVGTTNTSQLGYGLAVKHAPHIVCIAREQIEDGNEVVEQIRAMLPKTLIFIVSGTLDAVAIQGALARGVHGFIVKPFKADTVLKTIRNTVVAWVKKQQQAAASAGVPASAAPAASAPVTDAATPVPWLAPGQASRPASTSAAAPVRWAPPSADD